MSSETLLKNSDTLAQPPADARSSVGTPTPTTAEHAQKASSPATLSPSSPRAMSPNTASVHSASMAQPTSKVPPAVAELKSMFPDLDTDTIATVLSSRGGNQESAVNALLQMSDPSFKPTTSETRTDSDALLAQTIAMEEEQRHHELMARQQHSQSTGRGGGGAGSFFSGLLNSDSRGQSAPSAPSYDPNALTYQPRVRKAPSANPGVAGNRTSYAAPSHPPAASLSHAEGESAIPGMPGAKDAKQWQEEINRMAETGLARAATTFSSLRQKASAAFNNPQEGGAGASQTNSRVSGGNGGGTGFAQAFQNFRTGSGRGSSSNDEKTAASNASFRQGLTSPRSPNASEYDQDPSPVSENELAKIISRGGGSGGASANKPSSGKARALADRYGLGIKNAGRASPSTTQGTSGAASATGSQYAGWDEVGRTPISINDNTSSASTPRAATPASDANKTHLDSVALMDSAGGRGITSPRPDRSPSKESTPFSTAAAQSATSSSAAGNGSTAPAKPDADDANDDSDDLEYVSNPFEDED